MSPRRPVGLAHQREAKVFGLEAPAHTESAHSEFLVVEIDRALLPPKPDASAG